MGNLIILPALLAAAGAPLEKFPAAPHARIQPVPFNQVQVDDPFWSPWLERVQGITIPDMIDLAREQGKLENFRIVAGLKQGKLRLYNAQDSDIYKLLEAAAYTLAWRDAPELAGRMDRIIEAIAAAQTDDGYINTQYTLPRGHPAYPDPPIRGMKRYGWGPEDRWASTVENWPFAYAQSYCAGHLMEAAAAHHRVTGKRNFLEVAIKLADHLDKRFPPDRPIDFADHPQIGIGLMKLYEVTGETRYLKLADRMVNQLAFARPPDLGDGANRKPLREQRVAWGHAVRIHYIYSAATDLCRHQGDPPMREAMDSLWHSIVGSRIYVNGGVGGPAHAEQIAGPYMLDPFRTYSESCANIAHGQWNHRLNLMTGDARYADLVEVEAYNGGLAGISLRGNRFFYSNKLAVEHEHQRNAHTGQRERYLFCCPSKLPGFVGGICRWIYGRTDRSIHVNLFIGSRATIDTAGQKVQIRQSTRHPWDGRVAITVTPKSPAIFDLAIRIPLWARGKSHIPGDLYRFTAQGHPLKWSVTLNGEPLEQRVQEDGYLHIHRRWRPGDTVTMNLPMPVRRVKSHPLVEQTRGRIALMRGPVVYCLESVDNEFDVFDLVVPPDAKISAEHRDDLLGGVTVLRGAGEVGDRQVRFTAVPYYAWNNRGKGDMTVWLPESTDTLDSTLRNVGPMKRPDSQNLATLGTIAASTSMIGANTLQAVRDGRLPARSAAKDLTRLAWWPRKGTMEWVQCIWERPQVIDRVRVYWFADALNKSGGCHLPRSWRLLYRDGKAWKPVPGVSNYPVHPDRFNMVNLNTLKTSGLRLEVQLRDGWSGGIHEWVITPARNMDG